MAELDKMKEELLKVTAEIDKKTEKFNKSLEVLVSKRDKLEKDIAIEEGKVAIRQQEELNALLSSCGYSSTDLMTMLEQMKRNGSVTLTNKMETPELEEEENAVPGEQG